MHGDLKPANFLMVHKELKLIDFGIAKQIESNDTTNIVRDNAIGTLNYMAPEAFTGNQVPALPPPPPRPALASLSPRHRWLPAFRGEVGGARCVCSRAPKLQRRGAGRLGA